ncbi:MAG TPA: hypothetical protein VIJ79_03020 [Acidobacteriaceae bacterium]
MGDTVSLLDVIHVLEAHHVTVTKIAAKENVFIVEGNGVLEEVALLDHVGKKRLNRFARQFDIAIHLFWNLALCPPITPKKVQ